MTALREEQGSLFLPACFRVFPSLVLSEHMCDNGTQTRDKPVVSPKECLPWRQRCAMVKWFLSEAFPWGDHYVYLEVA